MFPSMKAPTPILTVPVSPNCTVEVLAHGQLTRDGISTLISYLKTIQPNFASAPKPTPTKGKHMNYPSLYNAGADPFNSAYIESLNPRQAELFFFMSGDLRDKLAAACYRDAILIDKGIMKDAHDPHSLMEVRLGQGFQTVPSWTPDGGVPSGGSFKVSTDVNDFVAFDYAAYLAAGGVPIRKKWIGNQIGTDENGVPMFGMGIDSTAYAINNTGNPIQNPNQLTVYQSPMPGENGAMCYADEFGWLVNPATVAPEVEVHRYRLVSANAQMSAFHFVLYDPAQA